MTGQKAKRARDTHTFFIENDRQGVQTNVFPRLHWSHFCLELASGVTKYSVTLPKVKKFEQLNFSVLAEIAEQHLID